LVTDTSAPMPSFSMSRRSSTWIESLNRRASLRASSARYAGVQMLGGRLPSVRASSAPSAVATASCSAARSGAVAGAAIVSDASAGAGDFYCVLSWSKR
jgi:hypothetical protein